MTDVRPVWLTRVQRDRLAWRNDPIANQWDAAPANPLTASAIAITEHGSRHEAVLNAEVVLRALGYPERRAAWRAD